MYQYQIDCESAMNNLLSHLEDNEPVFNKKDIFEAFEQANKEDPTYLPHLLSAHKYNDCSTVEKLLDYACACDLLIEYKGYYVAIDWTDNDLAIDDKYNKHKWLAPIYKYLAIEYTLVVKATRYSIIRNKTQETIARCNATKTLFAKLDSMINSGKTNGKLEFSIKTSF